MCFAMYELFIFEIEWNIRVFWNWDWVKLFFNFRFEFLIYFVYKIENIRELKKKSKILKSRKF